IHIDIGQRSYRTRPLHDVQSAECTECERGRNIEKRELQGHILCECAVQHHCEQIEQQVAEPYSGRQQEHCRYEKTDEGQPKIKGQQILKFTEKKDEKSKYDSPRK